MLDGHSPQLGHLSTKQNSQGRLQTRGGRTWTSSDGMLFKALCYACMKLKNSIVMSVRAGFALTGQLGMRLKVLG